MQRFSVSRSLNSSCPKSPSLIKIYYVIVIYYHKRIKDIYGRIIKVKTKKVRDIKYKSYSRAIAFVNKHSRWEYNIQQRGEIIGI